MALSFLALCVIALGSIPISTLDDHALLKELTDDYVRYGLPRLPNDASLVRIEDAEEPSEGRKRNAYLALIVKKHPVLSKSEHWGGIEAIDRWSIYQKTLTLVQPTSKSLQDTMPVPQHFFDWERFPGNPDLGLAIHSHMLGWDELAKALLERYRQSCVPHGKRHTSEQINPRAALARMAWNYWCNHFATEAGDRRPIAERMRMLGASGYGLDTAMHRNIIADMDATLKPGTADKNSLEAVIDQLVELKGNRGDWLATGFDDDVRIGGPLFRKIIHSGLDAVPTLLRHLDDFRLTRTLANDRTNYYWNVRVADVVAARLRQLVGPELRYDSLKREGRGVLVDKRQVEAWAAGLKGINERQFLLDNSFAFRHHYDKEKTANAHMLQMLAARYPDDFVRLWHEHVGKRDEPAYEFVPALDGSKLTKQVQEELLLSALKSQSPNWRYIAALQSTKLPALPGIVVAWLDAVPQSRDGENYYLSAGRLAEVATKMDNDFVWQALVKTAKRVDLYRRLEIIENVTQEDHYPHRQIDFCRQFLNDTSERIRNENSPDGGNAGFRYERLKVCDFAAEKLGQLLEVKTYPLPGWNADDWKAYQSKIADALKVYDDQRKGSKP